MNVQTKNTENAARSRRYFRELKSIAQTETNVEISSFAMNMLGLFYHTGTCVNINTQKSLKYYELAFAKGNMFAAHNLGVWYC